MTKKDFIDHVSAKAGMEIAKKDAEAVIDAAFRIIGESVRAESRFAYPNFGTFTVRERQARDGRNPRTGKKIKIKASKTVAFKPSPALRDSLQGSGLSP